MIKWLQPFGGDFLPPQRHEFHAMRAAAVESDELGAAARTVGATRHTIRRRRSQQGLGVERGVVQPAAKQWLEFSGMPRADFGGGAGGRWRIPSITRGGRSGAAARAGPTRGGSGIFLS